MPNSETIFITNSPDTYQGSSLYIITKEGTIRVSGANTSDRKATVFIRPYIIGYRSYTGSTAFFQTPAVGLYPYEAKLPFLPFAFKIGTGHTGNTITEVIARENFFNPLFRPKTWVGEEAMGIDWLIAQEKAKTALDDALVHGFEKRDIIIDAPPTYYAAL